MEKKEFYHARKKNQDKFYYFKMSVLFSSCSGQHTVAPDPSSPSRVIGQIINEKFSAIYIMLINY